MCPNAKEDKESKKWLEVYAGSIEKRLNAAAPGAHLKKKDTHSLMSLCAFHSQVLMAPSPFCGLFSVEEFTEYSYHADLAKFYTNGLAFFFLLLSFGRQLRLPFLVTERILVLCKELDM
jgi:Histidine phosphatase superfamily (branch 2)